MPMAHSFGGAEDKWNIIPFCSSMMGAGTEQTERAFTRLCGVRPVRGSIWQADTVTLHVPDIRAPPLCKLRIPHEQAPG